MKKEITVKELVSDWWNSHCMNLAKSTQYGYRRYLDNHFLPHLGTHLVCEVRQNDIQLIINRLSALGRSTKTQKNMVGILHSIFDYAVINDIISNNPVKHISKSKTTEYEYYIYSQKEFEQLLYTFNESRDIIPVLLGGVCGLRLSEVFGLKWSDINFEACTVHIRRAAVAIGREVDIKPTTKTKAGNRIIAVPEYMISIIKEYYTDTNDWIYPSPQNKDIPENGHNFYQRYNRKIKRAGLPHTRFHDLRHFAATSFLDAGVPDKYAAAYLGHSDTNMTRKYQHIRQQVIPYPMMSDNVIKIVNC